MTEMGDTINRLRAIAKAKADAQVEKLETPEVLARDAVRRVEEQAADLHRQLHASRTSEITIKSKIASEERKAQVLEARAHALQAQGLTDKALATMRLAMSHRWASETLEMQRAELAAVNDSLTASLSDLDQQRTIIKIQSDIVRSRYSGAQAARVGAEARYGKPGELGSSSYEKLELAAAKSEEVAASAMASVMIGQDRMAGAESSDVPDFEDEARLLLEIGPDAIGSSATTKELTPGVDDGDVGEAGIS